MSALRHLRAPAARHVVPPAVRGPGRQPAHRRRVPGRPRVVRRVLARAGSRARGRSPRRWRWCCCRSACSARSSGCSWTAGRAVRCWPCRTSCGSGVVAVLAVGVHADLRGPLLFVLVLVSLSVNRFLLAGLSASLPHVVERGRPDHRERAHPDRRDAGRSCVGLALGTGSRIGWERLDVNSDVGVLATAAVLLRRRRAARTAHPAATCSVRTSTTAAPGRARGRAARRARAGRRGAAPRRAAAGGVRPGRDRQRTGSSTASRPSR